MTGKILEVRTEHSAKKESGMPMNYISDQNPPARGIQPKEKLERTNGNFAQIEL